jgi:hypothetical protein
VLRWIVVLLIVANAAFFAWARGWLGAPPHHDEREPERVQAQVRPEALTVLPAKAAGAAVQAARAAAQACLEAGPFSENDVISAEALLVASQIGEGTWLRVDGSPPAVWLVFAGRYPEPALRKAREEDLKKLKLSFELIDRPTDLAPGFVLSRHASKEDAQAWVDARANTPLKGVRVVQLPAPASAWRLRVPRADSLLADRLQALPAEALAGGFKACAAKP